MHTNTPPFHCKSFLTILLVTLLSVVAQAQNKSLGDIARENREYKATAPKSDPAKMSRVAQLAADLSTSEEEYADKAKQLLAKGDFDGLEKMASMARGSKGRFAGGVWKLYIFYEAVSDPSGLAALQKWAKDRPQSITPYVALAQAYLNIGQNARGSGFADSVSDEGWRAYGEGSSQALAALNQAAKTGEKCPYYYAAMMQVANSQGWSKKKTHDVMEASYAYEPDFYHVYRFYANYLQPKWYGEPGEAAKFGEEISKRLGGDEGEFVYFEVATLLGCNTCGDSSQLRYLSWPRIKEGYAAMQRRYGTSKLKQNRYAYLAFAYGDKEAAAEAFKSLGDNWDSGVWSQHTFTVARQWALQ